MTTENLTSNRNDIIIIILIALISIVIFFFLSKQKKKSENQIGIVPEYTHVSTELNTIRGFNTTVRITSQLDEVGLLSIANKAKAEIQAKSEIGKVFFLLPEMIDSEGAWAVVNFTPQPTVQFIGQSLEDKSKIQNQYQSINTGIGLWEDIETPGDVLTRIRIDEKNQYVIEFVSSAEDTPKELYTILKKSKRKGKIIFFDTDWPGQYYQLESNGDLSVFNNGKFVRRYRKLK